MNTRGQEIAWQMECLDHTVDLLEEKVNELTRRLAPVLNEEIAISKSTYTFHTSSKSLVGRRIFTNIERVSSIIEDLDNIFKKLEI